MKQRLLSLNLERGVHAASTPIHSSRRTLHKPPFSSSLAAVHGPGSCANRETRLSIARFRIALTLVAVGLVVCPQAFSKDVPKKPGKPLLIQRVPEVPIPPSVFNIPSQPTEGRNPFYPQSTVKVVVPQITNPLDSVSFVLNGITSPPRRTAMINGRTFDLGEEAEVRMPSGAKVLIKVVEIKAESATIVVDGQRRELRLRAGV